MMTLAELLKTPRFSDLKLVTRHTTLEDKLVSSIEISETPDVANFIPKHILLLTTAMVYKEEPEALIQLITSLKKQEAAGIAIKTGRFIEEIDKKVIQYANEIDFPIIKIPSTQPLGGLLHQLLNYLWNTKTEQLSYALDIQKRFSDLLIHDVSIARFVAYFGKLINTPVVLLSPFKKIIAHSKHFSHTSMPLEHYLEQINAKHYKWIEEGTASFLIKNIDQSPMQIAGFPIKVNTYFPYYLLILNPEKVPYPVSEFAVEQACLVLSFMLYKNQKVQESLELLKSDFFAQLIESNHTIVNTTRDWIDLGANYGLIKSNYYQIIYVSCLPSETTATKIKYQREESDLAYQWLTQMLPSSLKKASVFKLKHTNHLAILIQQKTASLEKILENLSKKLTEKLPIRIAFSFGNSYEKIEQVLNSYIEAKNAYEEMIHSENPSIIYYYQPKGMKRLFEKMEIDDIHYFCKSVLKELAYPVEDSYIELRKTLKCYLDFQCEISKTAAALYLHRNTIKYRIDHCAKLLDLTIQDPIISLNLRLAIELSEQPAQQNE